LVGNRDFDIYAHFCLTASTSSSLAKSPASASAKAA
jgi:hypothetical protein